MQGGQSQKPPESVQGKKTNQDSNQRESNNEEISLSNMWKIRALDKKLLARIQLRFLTWRCSPRIGRNEVH